MKTKAVKILDCCKYELGIFVILAVQALINLYPFNGMSENFYVYYLVDFSISKTSRMLIGSLVNLLTDKPTVGWVNTFATVVLFAALVFVAVVLGQVIRASESDVKPQILVAVLFFATGSVTLAGFSKFFGMLDIYMFFFTVVAVIFARNRYLRWLIPLLCVAGCLVNYVYSISYFPLIVLVLFYLIVTQEKKAGNILLLVLTIIITVLLVFYCAFFGHKTTTVAYDELRMLLEQKSGTQISEECITYFEPYLYNAGEHSAGIPIEVSENLTPVQFVLKVAEHVLTERVSIFGMIPVLLIFLFSASALVAIWVMCIRNAETKGKKFVFLCFIHSMLFIPLCCLLSTDFIRWVQAGIIVQFGLIFFMFLTHDKDFEKTVIQIREFFKNRQIFLWLVFAVHAFSASNGLGVGA